jgi:carbamoyltransferase
VRSGEGCGQATRPEHRDRLGAVTHVDGSARLQTVDRPENPRFWALLKQFEKLMGLPILLNTSFNLKGQPIVKDPAVARETFVVSNWTVSSWAITS